MYQWPRFFVAAFFLQTKIKKQPLILYGRYLIAYKKTTKHQIYIFHDNDISSKNTQIFTQQKGKNIFHHPPFSDLSVLQ